LYTGAKTHRQTYYFSHRYISVKPVTNATKLRTMYAHLPASSQSITMYFDLYLDNKYSLSTLAYAPNAQQRYVHLPWRSNSD